ncbi:MAG: hypothetical protein COX57_06585 [Alphaproteobacteria bacterium CG_4_10_14_0_2_um_filter_63_37]|nr:MAG: hypothetical protein AUJ55_09225 [Proteobacteria bacterium CG1_02_64_396]PJA24819.1 MAG: hypothetical protein COX57_06585 [Alphaproteobacteria bacterium CG_4_10_14_0_2_um_filter_63_37]
MKPIVQTLILAAALLSGANAIADEAPGNDLRLIMQGLERSMTALDAALWRGNLGDAAAAARQVADHPKVGQATRGKIKQALGPDMQRFGEADHKVHEAATALAEAAQAGDIPATHRARLTLQQGCMQCHEGFRARVTPVLR